ncbi:hypothetical protein ACQ4LE_006288, partial [Meloidogyne hapla]
MCENFIEELAVNFNERKIKQQKNIKKEEMKNNFEENGDEQLYDSLCSLCLRCLPPKEFPYRLDNFPLKFVLPSDISTTTSSSNNKKIGKNNKKNISELSSSEITNFKITNLVDESDEDSNLWPFTSFSLNNEENSLFSKMMDEQNNDKEKDFSDILDDDLKEEENKLINKKDINLLPPDISQYSKLQQNELNKYQKYFPEFGNEISKQLIFDEFNNNNESNSIKEYEKIVLKEWKKINYVGNFVKIANSELFDCGDKINGEKENLNKNSLNNSLNRFESGNLWKAIQIGSNKYELILSPDINQRTMHFQWFYFSISNIRSGIPYIFEIINCLKNISMFSKGMQPVIFSTIEAKKGNIGWMRAGTEISYFRNLYLIPDEIEGNIKENI